MTDGIKRKFVAAWAACENPELDGENPRFHNRYASLKATLKSVRDACSTQGIAYMQRLYMVEGEPRRELVSSVTDGEESMDLSRFPVECPPNPQAFGSNLTYAKRQQAQADWGITGEPDDDGEAAAADAPKAARAKADTPAGPDELADAKRALWDACKAYAQRHGLEPKSVSDGCLKRPDFDGTPEWYVSVAAELEES